MKTKAERIRLIRTLKAMLKKQFGENIQDVILFGSQANDTATAISDYDVLIVLKNRYDWKYRKEVNHVIYDLELSEEVLFDTHLLSLYEMKQTLKGAEPIYQNALRQGVYA